MKPKLISALVLTVSIAANHFASAQTKPKTVKKTLIAAAKPPIVTPQDMEEGKMLISKFDCLACHHLENKLVGPSYNNVSEKYPLNPATIATLSQKIINGGSGVWGTIPMPPHPAIAPADAGKMVKYILSLKSQNK
jgi:cytochrome c